jgi:hypothetical protein
MPLRSGKIWLVEGQIEVAAKGIQQARLCHTFPSASARFDEPTLVSAGGLVPVLALADRVGLRSLVDEQLRGELAGSGCRRRSRARREPVPAPRQ